ncbi:MAG: hypothetical protein ACPGLV_14920 [Bacteroidia bacterium]
MRKFKLLLSLLSILLFTIACERNLDTEGPNLSDLYGEFKVIEEFDVSQGTVAFASGQSVHFTGSFSKIIDWKLTITGQATGAQKVFEGKSRRLDETNTLWEGETTQLPIFGAEQCIAELSVASDSLQFSKTISIESPKAQQEALVVADFENGWNDDWITFVQSGADMTFNITDTDPAGEGSFYYDMGGEVDWDWLIGLIEFPATALGTTTYDLSDNGNNVYFNTMLYLPEGVTNPLLLFQFSEDENEDGTFDADSEDMYSVEVRATDLEPGWNLYSIKYSDLAALANGAPVEPNGNGNHEPNKLSKVSLLYLANPSSGYAQTYMDFVSFTEGEPLKP